MSIDLHSNNDDLYRRAHERLEEEPSPDVWQKVAAKLDNRDARYYQQKSIRWKRTSLLLLLLLGTMLLTGVLYMATKKDPFQFAGINENGKIKRTDNRTTQPPVSSDSNTIQQNINQPNIYATKQPAKRDANSGTFILQSTAKKPLDAVSQQDNARTGKQYPQPVQDTSVREKEATAQQLFATKNTTDFKNKQVAEKSMPQRNPASAHQDEPVVYLQNKTARKQRQSSFFLAEKKDAFSRNSTTLNTNWPHNAEEESDALLLLQLLNVNRFSPYAISRKEAVDSNTLAQANAMATAAFKKETANENIAIGSSKKTVRIAPPFRKRFQLTAYGSFDFSEYHLDDDDDHENNNQQFPSRREDRHKIGDRENHGLSFSAGIMARLQTTKRLSFKSGFSYLSTTINSNPQTLYAVQSGSQGVAYKFVTSSGYTYIKSAGSSTLSVGDSAKTGTSQQQLQFLSLPVMAGYTIFSSNRFSIIPSVGAAANFLLGTRVKTEINEPSSAKETVTITSLTGLQSWYPSLLADAEVQYHFKRNISLTFIPSFRYAISPLTQNNAVKTSPYSFGLGLGFTYHF